MKYLVQTVLELFHIWSTFTFQSSPLILNLKSMDFVSDKYSSHSSLGDVAFSRLDEKIELSIKVQSNSFTHMFIEF